MLRDGRGRQRRLREEEKGREGEIENGQQKES